MTSRPYSFSEILTPVGVSFSAIEEVHEAQAGTERRRIVTTDHLPTSDMSFISTSSDNWFCGRKRRPDGYRPFLRRTRVSGKVLAPARFRCAIEFGRRLSTSASVWGVEGKGERWSGIPERA